jgi:hypothetical protein
LNTCHQIPLQVNVYEKTTFGVWCLYGYLVHVSRLCSGERLSYVYEVTESVWKPQLRLLLSRRLTALTRLTLAQFCDDDTLCLVGQCCPLLQLLRSTLGFMNPVLCESALVSLWVWIRIQLFISMLIRIRIQEASHCGSESWTLKSQKVKFFHEHAC